MNDACALRRTVWRLLTLNSTLTLACPQTLPSVCLWTLGNLQALRLVANAINYLTLFVLARYVT